MAQAQASTPGSQTSLQDYSTARLVTTGAGWYYELVAQFNAARPQTQDAEDSATEAVAL